MITPEEIEHIDWLILVNERRKVSARESDNNTLSGIYARAEQEAKDLKEVLLNPPSLETKKILRKIFSDD